MSLSKRFDRDIYQIVRKFEDADQDDKLTVTVVYEGIRRSNSSLSRLKRKTLEESIERVLKVRREELRAAGDDDDSDALVEAAEREREMEQSKEPKAREPDVSWLNRSIARSWNFNAGTPGSRSKEGGGHGGAGEPASTVNSSGKREMESGPSANTAATTAAAGRRVSGAPSQKKRRRGVSSSRGSDREDRPAGGRGATTASSSVDRSPPTGVSIRDVAGIDHVLNQLQTEVWFPLRAGSAFMGESFRNNKAVLLHGPSGCGKTMLAHALASSVGVAFIPVSAPAIVSGISGEPERQLRDMFDEAVRLAPCLLFIDELDVIAGPREDASKSMDGRIVASIMIGMDHIGRETPVGRNVVVLATTSRPDALDPRVRRRFDTEIDMGVPDEDAREEILRSMVRGIDAADDVDFRQLAKLTPGYVGSDLLLVVKAAMVECSKSRIKWALDQARSAQASSSSLLGAPVGEADEKEDHGMAIDTDTAITNNNREIRHEAITPALRDWLLLNNSCGEMVWPDNPVTTAHLRTAVSCVQPASRREGFSTIPDTTWRNVGALSEVRRQLEMAIIRPIQQPDLFRSVGIKAAAGILLWGPPGCGKTLVAKAVANESSANFISIKGPELLNKYVGESERAVREVFSRARSSTPCILFFDEIDALAARRSVSSSSEAGARVVNTLLAELDGVGDRSGVYVIGATNRPEVIDEAIRRPGRLGTAIFVGLPTPRDRVDILRTLWRNTVPAATKTSDALEPDQEAVALDPRCDGFSGADLESLLMTAAHACLERTCFGQGDAEGSTGDPVIASGDWEKALNKVKPSVLDSRKYGSTQ